jgi:hypothetical protein
MVEERFNVRIMARSFEKLFMGNLNDDPEGKNG